MIKLYQGGSKQTAGWAKPREADQVVFSEKWWLIRNDAKRIIVGPQLERPGRLRMGEAEQCEELVPEACGGLKPRP